jgi:hypothetical protein
MNGAPDPLYVAARVALLDALEALGEQRRAVVLVGAQAVYLHTGEATVAVAPYTTDADLAIDPSLLQASPKPFDIRVAGPAALLVSKLHKVAERAVEQQRTRLHDKDALDIYRILQAVPAASLASTLTLLLERDVARDVTREAMSFLERYFANPRSLGCQMVVRATEGLEDSETIAQSCSILAKTLLTKMAHTHEESLGARDSDSRW